MKQYKTPRRRLRRLGMCFVMVAGITTVVFGLGMYFLTDVGVFETEAAELPVLRAKADNDIFE